MIRYNSPMTQVALVGLICFCSVGMYMSVMTMGAGGTENVVLANLSNIVLYICYIIVGFFSGAVTNIFGPRIALFIGTSGYVLFIASLWIYQAKGMRWLVILGGAANGCSGAILWTAQGAIMMSYPAEQDKGRAFSLFWIVYMMGSIVGCSAALGIVGDSREAGVSTVVYLAFLIIIGCGAALAWTILPPHRVIRSDGSAVDILKTSTLKHELLATLALFQDRTMMSITPFAFSVDLFFAYHGVLNTNLFNGRTRILNGLLSGSASLVSAVVLGYIQDKLPLTRRGRAAAGLALTTVALATTLACSIAFHVHNGITRRTNPPHWDWTEKAAGPPIVLLMAFWICDALKQGVCYYVMSSTTNDPFKSARMASFYKSVISIGIIISYTLDAVKVPFLAQAIISWSPGLLGVPFMAAVIRTIKDTVGEDDAATPAATHSEERENIDDKLGEKSTITEMASSATSHFDTQSPVLGAGLRT